MSVTAAPPTRARLLAAAGSVIEEGGYGAASVLAIAQRAGVASGTLYRHFPSKEDLFVEVFRLVCAGEERAMGAAGEAMGSTVTEVDRLERVLVTFARRALRRPRLSWALIAEPVDPRVDAERIAYRARYIAFVAGALGAAVAGGEIPPLEVAFTAAAIVGGCGEALVGPLAPNAAGREDDEAVIASLRAFVRRAVGAEALAERNLTQQTRRT
jgi:AcrR family transcriptional regulator